MMNQSTSNAISYTILHPQKHALKNGIIFNNTNTPLTNITEPAEPSPQTKGSYLDSP
jgi:hypothetical protein